MKTALPVSLLVMLATTLNCSTANTMKRPVGLSCAWALADKGKNVPVKDCSINAIDQSNGDEYCFLGDMPKTEFAKDVPGNAQRAKQAYSVVTDQALGESKAMMK